MATNGGSIAGPSFVWSSSSYFTPKPTSTFSMMAMVKSRWNWSIACSAVQESSTTPTNVATTAAAPAAAATKSKDLKEEAAPSKPTKPPAKAPAKPLPEMIQEDVIPPLKAILEAQDDIFQIDLSFGDNTLEGSFIKKNIPYRFWAFFPDGVLTGPKGFSLSSYGSEVSTVEPFLVDEKRITAKHVVFWVEKRLAAQGIIPVWMQ